MTGCSSGIGRQCALGLAERGHVVIASARSEQDVRALTGAGLKTVRLDLDDPASIEEGLGQALEHTGGRLDVLFNNGAYGQPGAVEDLTREALRAQFETNLFGWHDLTRRVIPLMRAQGSGRIVQNSSVLGFVALPFRGAYVASKFALEGLSDTLRLELAGTGIHVVLIQPGPIESRFRENARRAFERHVDAAASPHADAYRRLAERLDKVGAVQPFTLPAQAVLQKLLTAIESPKPRARYAVTVPTHLLAALRRLLPTRALDALLLKVSRGGAG